MWWWEGEGVRRGRGRDYMLVVLSLPSLLGLGGRERERKGWYGDRGSTCFSYCAKITLSRI